SGWNVAVVLIVLFAVTPCARPPPSFHDTNTNRELLSVGCGDGASSQCAVPWSHHKLAGAPLDTLSTRTEGPDGDAANRARNCFLNVATTFVSLSIVRLWA